MTFKTMTAAIALTLGATMMLPSFAAEQAPAGKPAATGKEERARTLGRYSGWEGRERELGLIMNMVYKTLEDNDSYQHEVNDALVKHHLTSMQFAKDQNLVKEAVQHEIDTETPMLKRVAKMIEKSGDKDMALQAVFDQTTCHWQLVLDTEMGPGYRRYRSPWTNVLTQTTKLKQHDMTEQWIHENWTIPRMAGYSKLLGVDLEVSPWQEDGMITVKIKGTTPAPKQTSAVTN
jgi:hypothetical protein